MSTQRHELDYQGPGQDFKLLYVSHSKCENDWHSLSHSHYCAEIFYIMEGKGFFRVDSRQFPIHPEDLIIINPYTPHTELSFADNPLEYIVLGIDGVQFRAPDGQEQSYFSLNSEQTCGNYRFYIESILRESEERQECYLEVCSGLAQTLLALLHRHLSGRSLSLGRARVTSECARIQQYMDEHFKENITLDTLTALTHMNKHYLIHAFNKEIGCSPISYLLARRITESKRLLETSDHSVSEVGLVVGFSSASYFSQRFKKAVGVAPQEYRRIIRMQPSDSEIFPPS